MNTRYLDAALNQLRAQDYPIRDEDVARLSPFAHAHLTVTGTAPTPSSYPSWPADYDRSAMTTRTIWPDPPGSLRSRETPAIEACDLELVAKKRSVLNTYPTPHPDHRKSLPEGRPKR